MIEIQSKVWLIIERLDWTLMNNQNMNEFKWRKMAWTIWFLLRFIEECSSLITIIRYNWPELTYSTLNWTHRSDQIEWIKLDVNWIHWQNKHEWINSALFSRHFFGSSIFNCWHLFIGSSFVWWSMIYKKIFFLSIDHLKTSATSLFRITWCATFNVMLSIVHGSSSNNIVSKIRTKTSNKRREEEEKEKTMRCRELESKYKGRCRFRLRCLIKG